MIVETIEGIGKWILDSVVGAGSYTRFVAKALWVGIKPPYRFRNLFKQMFFVGVQSLLIVLITGLFTGAVFAYQANFGFAIFGAQTLVGSTVTLALLREMGPVLSALMVNGRVGSAMAAELGTMRVTEQVDALEAMAIDPIQFLVSPRILAAAVMGPVLTVMFDLVGTLGCFWVATHALHVPMGPYLSRIEWYVDPDDLLGGLAKSAVFGVILSSVGCYYGFYTRGGAEGVGIATTRAVVAAGVAILIVDYFMTLVIAPLGVSR